MKYLPVLIALFLLTACETPPKKEEANVAKINDLYVYILAEPQMPYQVIDHIKNDMGEQMSEATKGKRKFGDILGAVINTTAKNTSFPQLLNAMTNKAKEKHPDAEGIIFDTNMSKARVIRFANNN